MAIAISVIISTHERPDHLRRAVEALLRQTAKPAELIIVNDGLVDVDMSLAVRVAEAGIDLTYRLMDRPSLTASRNAGVDLATGDVVLLLDDDVLAPPDYLQRLGGLYEADRRGVIAGIGGVLVPTQAPRWPNRLWARIARATAENRWGPRRCAARYVRLPAALMGELEPAKRLSGGAISLRTAVARRFRFEERFHGYGLGEDTQLSFRLTQALAIYRATRLRLLHEQAPGGRPDPSRRGRMYAANMLHIYHWSTEGGAGTALLLGLHLVSLWAMSVAWSLATWRRGNARFAGGMAGELVRKAWAWARSVLCGR